VAGKLDTDCATEFKIQFDQSTNFNDQVDTGGGDIVAGDK